MKEIFDAMREHSQEKRAMNRENSTDILVKHNIGFVSKNNGAHLIVEGNDCLIDYWPGTGRWKTRNGEKGFGVRNLLKHLGI